MRSKKVDQTNPKDAIGVKKVLTGLLPAAGVIYGALGMMDGARKYGPYNWRDKHIRVTVYLDAMDRHIMAYRDGEDLAADSRKPHLGHVIACAAILADAVEGGFLIDDRPARGPAAATLERWRGALEAQAAERERAEGRAVRRKRRARR